MPFVPATPPPNMPSGKAIFARAQAVWHAQQLPPYVEFTTYIAQISDEPVRVAIRTSDGKAFVQTIPSGSAERVVSYPGVRLAGPGYSPLGICVSQGRCEGVVADPFDATPDQPDPSGLKTIERARVFSDPYEVVDTQYMDFDGLPVYDLKLQAQRDPDRYRMREVVIDAQTYHVWKMIYEVPNYPQRLVAYGFGPVADIWYLRQTCRAVPTSLSRIAVPACTADAAFMWDYAFPASVPDYYFDRAAYAAHFQLTQ